MSAPASKRLKKAYTKSTASIIKTSKTASVRRRIVNTIKHHAFLNPININHKLYRGLGNNSIHKLITTGKLKNNSVSSFSNNRRIATNFAEGRGGMVISLSPGRYPAIRANQKNFKSAYPHEREITLAPGTYHYLGVDRNNGTLKVRYEPNYYRVAHTRSRRAST